MILESYYGHIKKKNYAWDSSKNTEVNLRPPNTGLYMCRYFYIYMYSLIHMNAHKNNMQNVYLLTKLH